MAKKTPYEAFPEYVLRAPILSFSFYKKLTSNKKISDQEIKSLCEDPIINEAIFLASPSLHSEIIRWLNNEIKEKNKQERLKYSVLKYVSRMTSRCTPFGLFAGCSVGRFDEETNIHLKGATKNERHTRLDMNFLVALSQDLVKKPEIKNQILYYPNGSIYKLGDKLRYVEYYYKNSTRFHDIVAVDYSEYLEKVIDRASKGSLLSNLVEILIDDEISEKDALEFINELISNQILISELEPSVSGPEFLTQIFSVLEKISSVEDILTTLKEAEKRMIHIDSIIGNKTEDYIELSNFLKQLETNFELKYMFQTDLILNHKTNILNKKTVSDLKKGLTILNKITLPYKKHF